MASRSRAGAACQHCHARKSKCDGQLKGVPCSSCQHRGLVGCRILPSNRGQYIRKSRRQQEPSRQPPDKGALAQPPFARADPGDIGPLYPSPAPQPDMPELSEELSQLFPIARSSADDGLQLSRSRADSASNAAWDDDVQPVEREEPRLFQQLNACKEDISWSSIFESLLEPRCQTHAVDKASITYLGESFPLATVLEDLRREGRLQLHHPGPAQTRSPVPSPATNSHQSHLSDADTSFLQSKGAFQLPPPACGDVLFNTFVERVYPFYPVVIMSDLIQQYKDKTVPYILLHAIYFAGAAFCPLSSLHLAGFSNRRTVLETFYNRAKLLFDFGYEREKVVLLQSVVLLTFWPSSPADIWTFYQWVGMGVTIAEGLGLHRSMAHINIPRKDHSLLKRIWWILVIRDAFGSALYGRPVRINGVHCDVEFTTERDFIHDYHPDLFPQTHMPLCAEYFSLLSRLSLQLRDITTNRFTTGFPTPGQEEARVTTLKALKEWRVSLPSQLDWELAATHSDPFAATLAVLYNSCLMFMDIQRSRLTKCDAFIPSTSSTERPYEATVQFPEPTHDLAAQVIDILSSLVPQGQLASMPHEVFTGLFIAEAVTYTRTRSADTVVAKLGLAQLKSCQLLFYEVRDFWDPARWITQLFQDLLAKARRDVSRIPPALPEAMDTTDARLVNDWQTFLGDFSGLQHLFTELSAGRNDQVQDL
ncbi:fungal-specific transcription factor domain-containing protein [Aspergillus pseudocaelatus]|uniref:Fungal-specific transcription factor domain-containing protein n=1 Tax=Aspergillus pseudocaelatus TaxID=1825620 RepID=A0ABQ6X2K4_9EURO|nr:fungal-specific transcription factor domain-containing protein [Aspergillus pseudocaelatus]